MAKVVKKTKVITRSKKELERVMVVSREELFVDGIWNGINSENLDKFISLIYRKHKFITRGEAEEDASWKQIIPYLIFEYEGKYFLMRRKGDHTDRRLANKYSLGVGGHINRRDVKGKNIHAWAQREFEEEISYDGKYKTEVIGLLNHDANDVGMVHLGIVILVSGDSAKIVVKDEHLDGELVPLFTISKNYKSMETWSQIVYDFLKEKSKPKMKVAKKLSDTNNISGVLPDFLIREYIEKGKMVIDNLTSDWKEQLDQVSIDFHLGHDIKLFKSGAYRFVDTRRGLPDDAMEEVNLREGDPFILEPGAFAITATKEVLKLPNDILGRLEGKSSLARLGILVHSTAARFDPGWNGAPVLELGNMGPKPAILYAGMPICAFTFEKLAVSVKRGYAGSHSDRYSGSKKAVVSRIERHAKQK